MRPKRVLTVAASVGLLALFAFVGAGTVGAHDRTTIHVIEDSINVSYVPVGALESPTCSNPAGCQGDYVVWDDPLYDATTHAQVGMIRGECYVIDTAGVLLHCPGVTLSLTGRGDIMDTGLFDVTGKTEIGAITGGTGRFSGATGTVAGRAIDATHNDFVIDLGD
jgi:hypothetical protein